MRASKLFASYFDCLGIRYEANREAGEMITLNDKTNKRYQ